ncbi:hypothetical protein SLEP1_g3398 [Rubroshorea leprosula]|uniref:Uncharacterized protein n=1 Tax=Rubroshorea leprosula TaxID=152421 RepID=A0AAV5HTZ6_9ROSI|nr:hypothetical protein SLEP1_g3398 [Rubroshorea leprosula]
MIFPYFLVQELDLEPRNLSPLQELPDLPCSASSPPAALALWGRIGLVFLKFPKFQPASSPLHCRRPPLTCSPVPCLQILEAKPRTRKPREVTS